MGKSPAGPVGSYTGNAFAEPVAMLRDVRSVGAPGEIRTPDLTLRRRSLYPAELRARKSRIQQVPSGTPASNGEWSRRLHTNLEPQPAAALPRAAQLPIVLPPVRS